MTFLETILAANREQPPDLARYRDGRRSVGDGIEAADVAFYGPTALRRPATTRAEDL
ncbi:hypothetical protein [Cellulosimicrobium cellulans]|uniref:Uncharacterized protein n=1 Tax=Cellulosimicrobium cellulans TaxID=1710 RepID=A0A4Y4DWX6_CELCE|nr:hypothetical protein [Cellulosimicrobium cellulans]GED09892.1 hypothetical protein CCE02nite_18910 [Cellulosimicrobium cellulans]